MSTVIHSCNLSSNKKWRFGLAYCCMSFRSPKNPQSNNGNLIETIQTWLWIVKSHNVNCRDRCSVYGFVRRKI